MPSKKADQPAPVADESKSEIKNQKPTVAQPTQVNDAAAKVEKAPVEKSATEEKPAETNTIEAAPTQSAETKPVDETTAPETTTSELSMSETPIAAEAADSKTEEEKDTPLPENVEVVEVPSGAPTAWQQSRLGEKPAIVSPPHKGRARHTKLFLLILILLLIVLVGSAFAYYGTYLPNKPDNKLEQAFANLAQQKQLSLAGSVDIASTNKQHSFPGISVNFNMAADLEQAEFATNGTVGVSGTQFPFDVRYINKNVYFKLGGLEGLSNVLPQSSSTTVKVYAQILKNVDNQWYVIDRSFVDTMGASASCTTNLTFTLNNNDLSILKKAYQADPLFTVASSTPARVGDVITTKMKLNPASDATAQAFAQQLNNLSVVQNIHKCSGSPTANNQIDHAISLPSKSATADETIYAYVTNDKQLKKLELSSNANGFSDNISLTFNNQSSTISAPANAKPIQNLAGAFTGVNNSR